MDEKKPSLWERFKNGIRNFWENVKDFFRVNNEYDGQFADRLAGGKEFVNMKYQMAAAQEHAFEETVKDAREAGTKTIDGIRTTETKIADAQTTLRDASTTPAEKLEAYNILRQSEKDMAGYLKDIELLEYKYQDYLDKNEFTSYKEEATQDLYNVHTDIRRYEASELYSEEEIDIAAEVAAILQEKREEALAEAAEAEQVQAAPVPTEEPQPENIGDRAEAFEKKYAEATNSINKTLASIESNKEIIENNLPGKDAAMENYKSSIEELQSFHRELSNITNEYKDVMTEEQVQECNEYLTDIEVETKEFGEIKQPGLRDRMEAQTFSTQTETPERSDI